MATSAILEVPQITEAQSEKATAFNIGVTMLTEAMAEVYSVDSTGADNDTNKIILPYDDTDDLSDRTALRFIFLNVQAGASGTFTIQHPDSKHLFYVKNNSTETCRIKTEFGATVSMGPGAGQIVYCDGTDCIELLASSSTIRAQDDLAVNYFGTPQSNEVISKTLVARDTTFSADFNGAVGDVGTSPNVDGSVTLTVKRGTTTIGTIVINIGGSFTFATVGNVEQVVNAGQVLTVEAPAGINPTIRDIQFVLPATVSVTQ